MNTQYTYQLIFVQFYSIPSVHIFEKIISHFYQFDRILVASKIANWLKE
ncbi:unnamed protein product [Schistosoma margrebowiei]|uniref:Uncharacterized protein n=1 Tax=Schistosoma margrebowiei TaxID=48269 RepID=A0A183M0Y5_9TREM|nr:unnamed protein product [Schistosoma margrebowiei]